MNRFKFELSPAGKCQDSVIFLFAVVYINNHLTRYFSRIVNKTLLQCKFTT
jgi:hypothetical protein